MIKAQFKGTPIVPKDAVFPEIDHLRGDFGREVLAEYEQRTEKDYGNADALRVLRYSKDVVTGSNPFAVVLVNQIVRENGLRTVTPADLEMALNAGINLRGTYTDSAFVLRNTSDPNKYLAESISKQLKARGRVKHSPVMIPLCGLELVKDSNSPYGLDFKLRDDAKWIYADILNTNGGSFSSENIDLSIGLPKKLGDGNRTLYTAKNGLSAVDLDCDLDLGSNDDNLAGSYEVGRVRVASTEGAKPNQKFQAYLANLEQAKEQEIAKIEKRYGKALDILKGK